MTKALVKASHITTTPGSPGRAAVPATLGTPAYTSYDTQTVCGFTVPGATINWELVDSAYQLAPLVYGPVGATLIYNCQTLLVPTYHPAIAGTPAIAGIAPTSSLSVEYGLGWNAGARSLDSFNGDGFVQFTPLQAVGIVAGLNNNDSGFGYTEILFGLSFSSGIVRVYESGVLVFSGGAYTRGDVFRITRIESVVSYYKNSTLLYTSAVASSGPLFLDASLYAGGDTLDAPSIGNLTTSRTSLPALQSYGTQGNVASAVTSLPALMVVSSWNQGGATILPALIGVAADRAYASAITILPALTGYGDSGMMAPPYALSAGILPALIGAGLSLTHNSASAATSLAALQGIGSQGPYSSAITVLPALTVFSYSYEGNLKASLAGAFIGQDTLTTISEMVIVLNSSGTIAGVLSYTTQLSASLLSAGTLDDTLSAASVLSILLQSTMIAESDTPVVTAPGAINGDNQVWVLDWESNANTAYEDYAFNSFGMLDGKYYGAKADGVFLLEGDTDAGTAIHASVNLGRNDFDTAQRKAVPYAYAGVSASGTLYLRVTVDGAVYTYSARNTSTTQKVQRFDLGKGLKGSYYTFELYNAAGDDFDLDTVQFEVVPLSRKI